MLRRVRCLLFAVLAACAATPGRRGAESAGAVVGSPSWSRLSAPARLFIVSGRVLPVGVATCRSAARHAEVGAGGVSGNCDFVVVLDPDRNLPAIAGQTTLPDGRPLVAFSHAIVEGAANADELAFVLGHEVAHHVADHAPRQIARIDEAAAGAGRTLVAEGDEASSPASLSRVERPALGGAESRASLRGFELEADRLGSRIAAAAGYDEARGVRILGRLERRPGDWRPGDYCLLMRTREAAVSDALSGDAQVAGAGAIGGLGRKTKGAWRDGLGRVRGVAGTFPVSAPAEPSPPTGPPEGDTWRHVMEDADHHACIVFSHVINRERPVLLVARDAGYPPQFMSGADDHHGHKDGRIVGYGCLLENDPTLREVGTVLEGREYERGEVGGVWPRRAAASEGSGASVCGRT